MQDIITYLIFGLQAASIYAIAASGLVVTYTTSGIFNFAHGAVGMLAAFVYWELRFNHEVPVPIALIVVLLVLGPLLGLLIDRLIMRGLATASTITKIVVSVGLLFAFIQLGALIWPQDESYRTRRFFEGESVRIGDVNVTYHSLIVFAMAVVVAGALYLLLNRTRLGVAMRAVVDNRDLSRLNGIDPDRTSGMAWAIGCSLAALAGVLISPILQLDVVLLTLLVINAYAAALVGRLRSLPLTFLGALILGLVESYAAYFVVKVADKTGLLADLGGFVDDLITTGAIPILMLFVVLVVIPQDRASLETVRSRNVIPTPTLTQTIVGGGILVAAAFVATLIVPEDKLFELGKGVGLAIVMLSLVPLIGYAGQISLAQLAFAGVGAVVMYELGSDGNPLGLVLAVVIAGSVGALVALPALRLKGLYLALVTLSFAILFEKRILTEFPDFITGSTNVARVPRLAGFGSDTANFVLLAAAFAGVAILVAALRRGPFGRRLQALKDSPAACATLGLDLTATKLQVFALSAAIAGLGGALFAGWKSTIGGVNQNDFSLLNGPLAGLPVVLLAVIGGITSVAGAILGGLLLTGMPMVGQSFPALRDIMYLLPGIAGISLARNPDGAVAQIKEAVADRRRRPTEGAERGPEAEPVPLVPDRLLADGRLSAAELARLDEELGLASGGGVACELVAAHGDGAGNGSGDPATDGARATPTPARP